MDMFLPGRPIAKIQIYEIVDCGYVEHLVTLMCDELVGSTDEYLG